MNKSVSPTETNEPTTNAQAVPVSELTYEYDAFLSYSNRVDYHRARRIESFLESFHRVAGNSENQLRPLQICRDGSDFKLPRKRDSGALEQSDPVWDIIRNELSKSRYVIVLCSPGAVNSSWMSREVSWALDNHGPDSILPVVTEARDPVGNPEECFPPEIRAANLDKSRIWYDLRGAVKSARTALVRDYEDELVRLAGDLLEWDAEKRGPLAAIWQREQLKTRRRQATIAIVVAAVLIAVAIFAIWEAVDATRQARRARANATVQTADASFDPLTAALLLMELSPEEEPEGGMRVAERLASSILPQAVMHGHTGRITKVVFSPDRAQVLTASVDGTARIWRVDNRQDPLILGPHDKPVLDAVFNSDGSLIATASEDRTARIWKSGSTVLLKKFDHDDSVKHVRFTSDGRWVFTISQGKGTFWQLEGTQRVVLALPGDRTIVGFWLSNQSISGWVAASDASVWAFELNTQAELKITPGLPRPGGDIADLPTSGIDNITFSPDGSSVAIAHEKNVVVERLDKSSGPVQLPHEDRVNSVSFSGNGSFVVTGCSDGRVRRWDPQIGKVTRTFDPHIRFWLIDLFGKSPEASAETALTVSQVLVDHEGSRIVTFTEDGVIRIWDANNASQPIELRGHLGAEVAAFDGKSSHLVIGSDDGTARIWPLATPTEPLALNHPKPVYHATFSRDGSKVLSVDGDGVARIWLLNQPGKKIDLNASAGKITGAKFNRTASVVVTSQDDGRIMVWEVTSEFNRLIRQSSPTEARPNGIEFSPDETTVISWHKDGSVRLWPVNEHGREVVLKNPGTDVWHAGFSPDGTKVLATYDDGTARVWSTDGSDSYALLGGSDGHKKAVLDGAFSPDGRHVLTVSQDGTARIWSSDATGHPIVLVGANPAQEWLETCAYSPMGDTVVTTSSVGRVWIWRTDGQGKPIVLRNLNDIAHVGSVTSAAFSSDGKRILTGGGLDGALRIWRTDGTGRPINLVGHVGAITEASFSTDDARVVSASEDGTVRVWRTRWPDLLSYLRSVTSATLTVEQRIILLGQTASDARSVYETDERKMLRTPLPADWKFNYPF